jgi:hypothetical protein
VRRRALAEQQRAAVSCPHRNIGLALGSMLPNSMVFHHLFLKFFNNKDR